MTIKNCDDKYHLHIWGIRYNFTEDFIEVLRSAFIKFCGSESAYDQCGSTSLYINLPVFTRANQRVSILHALTLCIKLSTVPWCGASGWTWVWTNIAIELCVILGFINNFEIHTYYKCCLKKNVTKYLSWCNPGYQSFLLKLFLFRISSCSFNILSIPYLIPCFFFAKLQNLN